MPTSYFSRLTPVSSTADYGVVTHGQTVMELTDGSRTAIDAGGIIVQLGTAHAWHNEKDEWCRELRSFRAGIVPTEE